MTDNKASSSPRPGARKLRVLLAYMPFSPIRFPAIGVSLLKAIASGLGFECRVDYFNLDFAGRIGEARYLRTANGESVPFSDLFGEWLFKHTLYPGDSLPADREFFSSLAGKIPGEDFDIRDHCEPFISDCLEKVLAYRPDVVGFSDIFQQNIPSLALAKRVKEQLPQTFVIFGGSNCRGIMGEEMMRLFPFLDAVASGEGEAPFKELLLALSRGAAPRGIPGLLTRVKTGRAADPHSRPERERMDALPVPDYSDYFSQLKLSRLAGDFLPRIPFETSRGCWWGEKKQCAFCAQNGPELLHRSKSPARAVAEYGHLRRLYPGHPFIFVDNMPAMDYFNNFFPEVARRKLSTNIYIQLRPQLTERQFGLLRDSGVTTIMAGLEGLNSRILSLMDKGLTALSNALFLRRCREFGITPAWNILCGFPGETNEDIAATVRLLPSLFHLQPPISAGGIRVDRFSPHFRTPRKYGLKGLRPKEAYSRVYPYGAKSLARLAMYFDYSRDCAPAEWLTATLQRMVGYWRDRHPEAELLYLDRDGETAVYDSRKHPEGRLRLLSGLERAVFLACGEIRSTGQLRVEARRAAGRAPGEAALRECLKTLEEEGLLLRDGDLFLTPAIPLSAYRPAKETCAKFNALLRSHGLKPARFKRSPFQEKGVGQNPFFK